MLSPRSLLELAPYLRETFSQGEDPNDEDAPECEQERTIVDCNLCMSIVTSVSAFLPKPCRLFLRQSPMSVRADSRTLVGFRATLARTRTAGSGCTLSVSLNDSVKTVGVPPDWTRTTPTRASSESAIPLAS